MHGKGVYGLDTLLVPIGSPSQDGTKSKRKEPFFLISMQSGTPLENIMGRKNMPRPTPDPLPGCLIVNLFFHNLCSLLRNPMVKLKLPLGLCSRRVHSGVNFSPNFSHLVVCFIERTPAPKGPPQMKPLFFFATDEIFISKNIGCYLLNRGRYFPCKL